MAILNVYTVPNLERVISSPFPYPHPMVFFFAYQHFLLVHGLSFALCLESCPLSFVKIINMSNSYWSSYPVAQMVKKKSACNMGDLGLIPGSGRSPGVRKWQPTPVFLPGEFYGQRSLAGYSSCSHKESDMTERLTLTYIVSVVEGAVVNKQRRASPLGASPFEEESQHLFYFILFHLFLLVGG